jgi:glycine/D-amino acid oxidase-like deaminating enzyme
VYDQTDITEYNFDEPNKVILQTETGHTVTCKEVIFCSGFESVKLLQENIAHLFYTYASVSEQFIKINEKLRQTLVWDTGEPYSYMRATDDGRFLIGGEDAEDDPSLSQQKIKEQKAKKLERKINKLLPGVEFIADFNWGGTFGSTADGLPYIGRSPEYDKAIFVLGFGGNGITFSVQGMEMVCDILEEKKHPLAKYYRFGR